MIKVSDESEGEVFPLGDLPRRVPRRRGGKALHKSTGFRWAAAGVRGVRLETLRIGGTLCTSERALQEFFESLTAEIFRPAASPPKAKRARDVEARLDRAGIRS